MTAYITSFRGKGFIAIHVLQIKISIARYGIIFRISIIPTLFYIYNGAFLVLFQRKEF